MLLPPQFHPLIPHLSPYFLTSFGSFTRMDYGTGHELSFALFLCCLSLVRFFPFPTANSFPSSDAGLFSTSVGQEAEEQNLMQKQTLALARSLALILFPRYLSLTWRLQDIYQLEPAGSHGVWGLDDSSFLGYIWGSAQLRGTLVLLILLSFFWFLSSSAALICLSFLPKQGILTLISNSQTPKTTPQRQSSPPTLSLQRTSTISSSHAFMPLNMAHSMNIRHSSTRSLQG
jgi:hypothetical protein